MTVSLSDEERRSLEELERELASTDPDLASELTSGRPRGEAARTILGTLAVLGGFAMVIAGIMTQLVVLGVLGFLLASAGAYWLLAGTWLRRRFGTHDDDPAP
ncbi:DUF3040 domain-containing protein [Paenarthrobacter sp. CM16]|jgi:hypothetical protein|uniref:DUF3040 domain-containing protein n=1 Tax=Paenarthrobacter sp. CM16 TaxID=2738447 RepID=UPI001C12E3E1|nr:DUF3040 domain-containing protein [Paenarthrobacter sp. CM16]